MIALSPTVTATVAGVELLATEAGRGSRGVTATVVARNDRLLAGRQVRLAHPADRAAFAREVAAAGGVEAAQAERALLDLLAAVEGVLRAPRQADGAGGRGPNQATRLTEIAAAAELFHTPAGEAFASVSIGSHRENYPVRSRHFRRWLSREYYRSTGTAPGGQALTDALNVIDARAVHDGPEAPVFTRIAECDGNIYLDLGTASWAAVRVGPDGWAVDPAPPVRFRRAAGMAALPEPAPGGRVADLRTFLNVGTDADFILVVSWVLAAYRPRGPYPLLVLGGEQGSSKSTAARILRSLVDPSTSPLRAEPREARDMMIGAQNAHVMALDNLSYVQPWLSDALCRLSTGGGFAVRQLYTDDEETIFEAVKPVLLTGVDDIVTRSDLLDRSLLVHLPVIPDDRRRTEADFWAAFETARPRLLGAFLDAVAAALTNLPSVRLEGSPRMADFAYWATAAEPALGLRRGAFLEAFSANRAEGHELALEGSVIAHPLQDLVRQNAWQGTATRLLDALDRRVSEEVRRQRAWPKNAKSLSNLVKRIAPNLRAIGIEVEFHRESDRSRARVISIRVDPAIGANQPAGEIPAPLPEPSPTRAGPRPVVRHRNRRPQG